MALQWTWLPSVNLRTSVFAVINTIRLLSFDTTRTEKKMMRSTILLLLRVYSLPRESADRAVA
jgi:hypothetical protein